MFIILNGILVLVSCGKQTQADPYAVFKQDSTTQVAKIKKLTDVDLPKMAKESGKNLDGAFWSTAVQEGLGQDCFNDSVEGGFDCRGVPMGGYERGADKVLNTSAIKEIPGGEKLFNDIKAESKTYKEEFMHGFKFHVGM